MLPVQWVTSLPFISHRAHPDTRLFPSPQIGEQVGPFTSSDVACMDWKTSGLNPILTSYICLLFRPCTSGNCCCFFVFNKAQRSFQVPLNFTLNQLFVHTVLSSISSRRIYELVDWSRIKVATDFSDWGQKTTLESLTFSPEKKQETTFG